MRFCCLSFLSSLNLPADYCWAPQVWHNTEDEDMHDHLSRNDSSSSWFLVSLMYKTKVPVTVLGAEPGKLQVKKRTFPEPMTFCYQCVEISRLSTLSLFILTSSCFRVVIAVSYIHEYIQPTFKNSWIMQSGARMGRNTLGKIEDE